MGLIVIFSDIIILFGAMEKMPRANFFCPQFWEGEDFDSEGDFYWQGMEDIWTDLRLTRRCEDGNQSEFSVGIYREREHMGMLDALPTEVRDLSRFVGYRNEGRYSHIKSISESDYINVASFKILTPSLKDYNIFIDTVYAFLVYSQGVAENCYESDASEFSELFSLRGHCPTLADQIPPFS